MNNTSFSKHSETDWDFLHSATDEDIDLSDIPEITEEQIERATMRVGRKPVPKGKVHVEMSLDADVVAFFKVKAGERNYQALINDALRNSMHTEKLETLLRRVIREELTSAA